MASAQPLMCLEGGRTDVRRGSGVGEVAGPELIFRQNAFGIESHNTELSRCLQSRRSFHRNQLVQSSRSSLQNCLLALRALVTDAALWPSESIGIN